MCSKSLHDFRVAVRSRFTITERTLTRTLVENYVDVTTNFNVYNVTQDNFRKYRNRQVLKRELGNLDRGISDELVSIKSHQ